MQKDKKYIGKEVDNKKNSPSDDSLVFQRMQENIS